MGPGSVAEGPNVRSHGSHLLVGELRVAPWWHGHGVLLGLGDALGHDAHDLVVGSVDVQPLLIGQIGTALAPLSSGAVAFDAASLTLEERFALAHHLRYDVRWQSALTRCDTSGPGFDSFTLHGWS